MFFWIPFFNVGYIYPRQEVQRRGSSAKSFFFLFSSFIFIGGKGIVLSPFRQIRHRRVACLFGNAIHPSKLFLPNILRSVADLLPPKTGNLLHIRMHLLI